MIDVRVNPFADVFVDGELVGTTPIKPLELSAGPHKILLSNAELKAHRSYRIVVKPEVRTRLEADLTQAP